MSDKWIKASSWAAINRAKRARVEWPDESNPLLGARKPHRMKKVHEGQAILGEDFGAIHKPTERPETAARKVVEIVRMVPADKDIRTKSQRPYLRYKGADLAITSPKVVEIIPGDEPE